jgi:3-hydroxyisobutyrate dehydrogenase-like beta-hydroxyacid dehydrogenase
MATVTWIGFGQMGRPMVTDLRAAGPTVRGMDLASDAEFAQLMGGVR